MQDEFVSVETLTNIRERVKDARHMAKSLGLPMIAYLIAMAEIELAAEIKISAEAEEADRMAANDPWPNEWLDVFEKTRTDTQPNRA